MKQKPTIIKRALALSNAMNQIAIEIDPDELIVGNRAVGAKTGVVSPEGGISWLFREIDILPTRPQDKFQVRDEDKEEFRSSIFPYWKGLTLEDKIQEAAGEEIGTMSRAVKINQKDHAQGHICPSIENWLHLGAAGLKQQAQSAMENASPEHMDFYQSVIIVLDGAIDFMKRYAALARQMAEQQPEADKRESLLTIADNCALLAEKPPETYHQAVQAIWFLFVLLEAESNASSFSPGRVDQFLLPYFQRDMEDRRLSLEGALEIMEAMWIKFNEIVYMRNTEGAAYFAGFPIGFNIAIGGQDARTVRMLQTRCPISF